MPPYIFLKPVSAGDGAAMKEKDGKRYPVLEEIPPGDQLAKDILPVLGSGMPATSLKLDRMTKRFMLSRLEAGDADPRSADVFKEPLYICLMKNGNRPKRGFYLHKSGEMTDKTQTYFIEMPPESLSFEKIFSHELGHLLDSYLTSYHFNHQPYRPPHTTPAISDQVTPLENIYLKIQYAKYFQFAKYAREKPREAGPLFLDFAVSYLKLFPEDANDMAVHLAEGFFLATIDKDAQRSYEVTNREARLVLYDMQPGMKALQDMAAKMKRALEALKTNSSAIAGNVGGALWLKNDKFGFTVLGDKAPYLSINLNTAESYELLTINGMMQKAAEGIIAYRDANGYFSDIRELKKIKALNTRQYRELERLRALHTANIETN